MFIDTRIVVHTPIDKAWQALINFDSYQDWNPFMVKMTIEPQLNSTGILQVTRPMIGVKLTLPIKVIHCHHEATTITWTADIPTFASKVIQGVHSLQLSRIDESSCELIHTEQFSGFMSPALRFIKALLVKEYDRSNQAFKAKVEQL